MMSIQSKITTLICVIMILLIFFLMGLNSVTSVKPAKVDKKTAFLSQLVEIAEAINKTGDRLYSLLISVNNLEPEKIVKIENDDGTVDEVSEYDVFYSEIKEVSKKSAAIERNLDKLSDNEYSDNYKEAFLNFNKALEILSTASDDIVNAYEEDNSKKNIAQKANEISKDLGNDDLMIKYYTRKAVFIMQKAK